MADDLKFAGDMLPLLGLAVISAVPASLLLLAGLLIYKRKTAMSEADANDLIAGMGPPWAVAAFSPALLWSSVFAFADLERPPALATTPWWVITTFMLLGTLVALTAAGLIRARRRLVAAVLCGFAIAALFTFNWLLVGLLTTGVV